jgi:membrane protein implicated in regulation of membrane protease activity
MIELGMAIAGFAVSVVSTVLAVNRHLDERADRQDRSIQRLEGRLDTLIATVKGSDELVKYRLNQLEQGFVGSAASQNGNRQSFR